MNVANEAKPRVLLCVAGGIAAYKSVVLLRELMHRGYDCRVAMTRSASEFVGAATFSGLTGQPTVTSLWDQDHAGEIHVELAQWADAVVVAPATANLLSRAAAGGADDVVLATLLCTTAPVLYAPAMHHSMWHHPATQQNIALLQERGAHFVGPEHGELASGEHGMGRMSEPGAIADALDATLSRAHDLRGVRIVVTAGPTYEDIDPVRYIGNRSSGKMGYALAARAAARGADVTLISGPVSLSPPSNVTVVHVRSASQMHEAVTSLTKDADALIMAAAVADYRPKHRSDHKLHRDGRDITLELVPNVDILASVGKNRPQNKPVLVGFSLETDASLDRARAKLIAKHLDFIVANRAEDSLEGDTTTITLVSADDEQQVGPMPKVLAAHHILDAVAQRLATLPDQEGEAVKPRLTLIDNAQ